MQPLVSLFILVNTLRMVTDFLSLSRPSLSVCSMIPVCRKGKQHLDNYS